MSTKLPTYIRLKGQSLIYAVTLCSSIGFLLFGYDLGYMGGLTTSQEFLNTFNNPDAAILGFFVSIYEIGAMIGAAFTFSLGDRLGRRANNLIGATIVAVGAVIQCSSFSTGQFLFGRIVAGFGLGMMTSVIPVWLAECAMPKSRGRMVAMQLSNLIVGVIIANWLDYGMSRYAGSVQWRLPCAFQIIFCVITLLFMPFLPESPRYLARVGKMELALQNLAALRGLMPDAPEVQEEMEGINVAIELERNDCGSWADIFRDHGSSGSTRVAISFAANFLQQMSGTNVMASLGPYLFNHSMGMSSKDSMLLSGGLQIFQFLCSFITWAIIDRVGRRRLFMIGSSGLGLMMALSAIFVGIGTKKLDYAAIACLYLYQTFFTIGWMGNLWIYPSELLPLKLRLRGGAVASISQWLWTFLVVEITPVMITNIGFKTYVVFAIFNAVTVVIVFFVFPETSGLPLEAVDLLFEDREGKRPSVFRVVRDSRDEGFVKSMLERLRERGEAMGQHKEGVKSGPNTVHAEKADMPAWSREECSTLPRGD